MNDEVVFSITKQDVINTAKSIGIPEDVVTDDVLHSIGEWFKFMVTESQVIKDCINMALKS